jgi:hypothetical protein
VIGRRRQRHFVGRRQAETLDGWFAHHSSDGRFGDLCVAYVLYAPPSASSDCAVT